MPPRRRLESVKSDEKSGDTAALAAKVAETLGALTLQPEDSALAAVAMEYARTIDRAAAIAARAAKLPPDPDIAEELANLRKRVSAQVTMSDLGPKLVAALDALTATPKARAAQGKPAGGNGPSRLAAMRSGA